jgi:ribonuclease P protein component
MLAAGQRLRRADEFAAVIRGGRRAGRGCLVVHLAPRTDAVQAQAPSVPPGSSRAGFVVPKAVGNAVIRNLVRRRLRHALRERLRSIPIPTDVVVRVQPGAADRSYAELVGDLDDALRAARSKASRSSAASRSRASQTAREQR